MARTDEAEATIRILGEDLVTDKAAKAEKNVEKIGDAAEKVKGPLGRLRDRLDELGESTFFTELNQASELAGKALGVLAAGYEQLKQAAADRTIANAFNSSFGADGVERLATATQGLLADGYLRELANQGARAGLSLEQVAKLLESSTRAALGSGKDLRETADAFLKSTIEGNDEATKQLGVLVDLAGAQDDYARTLGITADRLTGAQKAQASLVEITRQADAAFEGVTGDASLTRLSRLETKWQNFTATMREAALAATVGFPEWLTGDDSSEERTRSQESRAAAERISSLEEVESKLHETRVAAWEAALKAEQGFYSEQARAQQAALETYEAQLIQRKDALLAAQAAAEALAESERELARQAAEDIARYGSLERKALVEKMEALQAMAAEAVFARQAEAELAGQFLDTATAASKWTEFMEAADAAQIDLVSSTELMSQALRVHQSEMVRTLELQAEMAELAGDVAGAFAARSQAASLASGDSGRRGPIAPAASKGGGGGKSKLDASLEANAQKTAAGQQRLNDAMWALRDQAEQLADEQHQLSMQADEARFRERVDLALQHHEEQQRILSESRQSGFDSLTDSILGLRDALGELDGISLDGLANAAQGMGPLMAQFDALANATDKSKGAMVSGSLGIAAASGKMVAGIIKDQRAQAIIMALVEQAEAWGAFARYDYVSFGAHMVSSALWGTIAGTSGGGGGRGGGGASGGAGGRGARETPRVPNEAPPDGPTFNPITIHISGGTYLGTDAEKTGRALAQMVDRHRGRSFRSGDGGSPP